MDINELTLKDLQPSQLYISDKKLRTVAACKKQAIVSPEDLLPRIISENDYIGKWDKWCDRMQAKIVVIEPYTKQRIPEVLMFEQALRAEEDFWGWEINEEYIKSVTASFENTSFSNSLSFLAYQNNHVIGRIDAVLIPSHFDGSIKAYLDWICVLKSSRHRGVAQKLLATLLDTLKKQNVDTLIALTASNEEAQRFYRSVPNSEMRDVGIWIDIK